MKIASNSLKALCALCLVATSLSAQPLLSDIVSQADGETTEPVSRAAVYGRGFAGTRGIPRLSVAGHILPAHTVDLFVNNTAGKKTYGYMLMGFRPRKLRMPAGGMLLVDAGIAVKRVKLSKGRNVFPFAIPADVLRHGSQIYVQVLIRDKGAPGGFSFSPGLKLTLN